MVTDGPHGLRKQAGAGDHLGLGESVAATCFPTAAGLGATFDEALLTEVGTALGRECQAEDVAVLLGPGLESYLGGQAAGSALAEVLLGLADPGGRLAESFPVDVADLPADRDVARDARQVEPREGLYVGYRFHDRAGVAARFPFGHGLSYTRFSYGELTVRGEGTDLQADVTVTNVGERHGSEVVQLYVRDVASSVHRPDKELRAFAKVHLDPAASTTVTLSLDRRAFAFWDAAAGDWQVEAGTFELLVGSSSTDLHASVLVEVPSTDEATPTDEGAPAETPPRPPSGFWADDDTFAAMLGHPIPRPAPVWPFHRNSTVADLAATRAGAMLQPLVLRAATRHTEAATAEGDDATRRMFEAVIREAPLRALTLLNGGTPSLEVLDAAIAALNGDTGTALRRVRQATRTWMVW